MISPNEGPQRLSWILAAGAAIALFFAFTFWAGVPTDSRAGIFWTQIVVMFALVCLFVALAWHLFLRPLASNLRQPKTDTLAASVRQRIALVLAGGGMALFIGAIWDEMWHRSYGIPFGEDFFWRPHLLMYLGFATAIVAGFWSLFYLNRHLKGNFQQRFRSNSMIGLLIFNAGFMLYSMVTDPLWHWTYGEDLSAWSVPHLLLLASIAMSMLTAALLHLSTITPASWRTILRFRTSDTLPIFTLTAILMLWLQVMLIDWDQTLAGIQLEWLGLYRPEWLLAANMLAGVTLIGVVATRLLRCAGAATAVGLLALAIRFVMIQLFAADMLQYVAWVAALVPLLGIDLWTFYSSAIRHQDPEWRGTAFAVIVAMAINSLAIRGLYNLEASDFASYALAVTVSAVGMSWLSHQISDRMLGLSQDTAKAGSGDLVVKPQVSFGILGAFVVFIVFFVVTASPPV